MVYLLQPAAESIIKLTFHGQAEEIDPVHNQHAQRDEVLESVTSTQDQQTIKAVPIVMTQTSQLVILTDTPL